MKHAAKIAYIATTDHSQCSGSPVKYEKNFQWLIFSYQSHDMFQTAAENTSESSWNFPSEKSAVKSIDSEDA